MAEQVGSIFTTIGISIDKLKELGDVSKQLKRQLGDLGTSLTTVGVKLQDLGKTRLPPGTILDQFGRPLTSKIKESTQAIEGFGIRIRQVGESLQAFGANLSRTLGIALRWFIAYRVIRGVLSGIAKGFEDIKALEIEEIFTDFTFAGESATEVLEKIMPLSKRWGIDIISTYRAALQFGRALGDMYEMDLPRALALTNVAMKTTVASGQNLNESIANMVGYIRMLGLESVAEIDRFMSVLYAAAFRTDEALTHSGESVKGGALAMDSLTDAMQRMLPGMKRFGLSWEQIAAIASIFITNLDEAGQGIGAYTAKLFEAIKGNQDLKAIYEDVGIDLTRQSEQLIPALVEGYKRMTEAQRDEASAATRVGIGAHIVATFWESLTQIQERANDIKNKSILLDEVASRQMETLTKKQDQLNVSMQEFSIRVMQMGLPAFKGLIDLLTKTAQAVEWTGKSIGITAAEIAQGVPLALKAIWYGWTGQKEKFDEVVEQTKRLEDVVDKELVDAYQEVFGLNEEMIKQYMDMQLQLQRMFAAKQMGGGVTPDDILILEDAKRVMQEYAMQVKIAENNLGVFASKQEIGRAKTELLKEELEKLKGMLEKLHGLAKLQVELRISDIERELKEIDKSQQEYTKNLELSYKYLEMEQEGYNEIVIQKEKIRDLEREIAELKERGLAAGEKEQQLDDERLNLKKMIAQEQRDITNQLRGIISRELVEIIKGTSTWGDLLANIGDYILQKLIEKLIDVFILNQLLSGISTIITSIPTGGGGKGSSSTGGGGTVIVHKGGEIPMPRFQFGGEVPALLEPGEYVVSEGPAQRYKGLLEAINRGEEIGAGNQNTYIIQAVDAASFFELVRRNPEAIHYVVQEAKRFRRPGFRGEN